MPLFDPYERTDSTPASNIECTFEFLNRSAWKNVVQIREVLDSWFDNYPTNHAAHLRSRFRSKSDNQHFGAFFELLVHQLLIALSCSIQIESDVPSSSKHPDFLAKLPTGDSFYIETVLSKPGSPLDFNPHERAVFDEINKLICPDFWLIAEKSMEGELSRLPPLRQLRTDFQAWIDGLSYEELRDVQTRPRHSITFGDWTLTLAAYPRGQAARGKEGTRPLGMYPTAGGFVDCRTPIKNAITEKANRYGKLGSPFIIGVDAVNAGGIDRIDVMEALFGKEQITYKFGVTTGENPPVFSRKPDGAWRIHSGPINTRVSAVLLFENVSPWNIAEARAYLYKNPWTDNPCPKYLDLLPHVVVSGEQAHWIDGETLGNILGLPEGWPGPK